MDLGLRDRVYLVTGGSRGLGFAAAQALVTDGARVVLSAPHQATAAAAATRLTQHGAAADTAAWVVADNADPATPGRLIAAAKDRFGRLDGALISVGGTPAGTAAPVRPVSSCAAARPAAVWRSGQREPQPLPPPWTLVPVEKRTVLEAELHTEVAEGHPLFGQRDRHRPLRAVRRGRIQRRDRSRTIRQRASDLAPRPRATPMALDRGPEPPTVKQPHRARTLTDNLADRAGRTRHNRFHRVIFVHGALDPRRSCAAGSGSTRGAAGLVRQRGRPDPHADVAVLDPLDSKQAGDQHHGLPMSNSWS